jgi:hypothetical protein
LTLLRKLFYDVEPDAPLAIDRSLAAMPLDVALRPRTGKDGSN